MGGSSKSIGRLIKIIPRIKDRRYLEVSKFYSNVFRTVRNSSECNCHHIAKQETKLRNCHNHISDFHNWVFHVSISLVIMVHSNSFSSYKTYFCIFVIPTELRQRRNNLSIWNVYALRDMSQFLSENSLSNL